MAQRALGQRTGRAADRSARPRPSPAGRVAVWRAARPARPDPRDRQAARAADPRRARASLDPLARREFLQSLMEVVAEGDMTVVLSSHLIPGNPPPHHLRHQPARLPCPVTRDQHHGPGTQQARASPACATQPPTDRARETAHIIRSACKPKSIKPLQQLLIPAAPRGYLPLPGMQPGRRSRPAAVCSSSTSAEVNALLPR
jgi:hypothetical protein